MVLPRKSPSRLVIGTVIAVIAVIVGALVASSIHNLRAKQQRAEQVRQLKVLLPAYQSRFATATPHQVELAAEQEHAEARGSGKDETFFFQERHVVPDQPCSAETVAVEVIVDQTQDRVGAVRLGGRYIDCL